METVFFWIAWGIISFWALKTFYFSFSKEKIERLRKAALGFHLAIFVLIFLPWLPPALGGVSGLTLAFTGNMLATLFLVLIILSTILFFTKEAFFMKVAAGVTIVNTFVLFILMYSLRSTTFTLTPYDIAPIIAVLLLLVCDVVVLLLWQQLQLQDKSLRNKPHKLHRVVIFTLIAIFIVLGFLIFRSQERNEEREINAVLQLSEVQDFKKAVEENGKSKFAVTTDRQEGPYSIIKVFESFPDHITTFNWYKVKGKTGKVFRQDIATDTWEEVK
ncbi:hypothetical protein A3C59_04150 [Candidatus Daviesbacteria bacterium RIFCSPHIGHO2_02_FULL_36_13]|uniref:Uncharacterized protein n=1 Tax=Candidatus Daviesbacteria bacterium RIFCSPHIGHO2_02_FULL_36_13 TaxID=1797768 RepID=A0A1F5JRW0_9BACT|nr:MAG: hypothetical protein A3C59_04150 [Candidatus Daviesbacteria bacterium RIFCSPHIGHO2_02_FULL_36_13]